MLAARHPFRWWNWCFSNDDKKGTEPIFVEFQCVSVQLEGISTIIHEDLI